MLTTRPQALILGIAAALIVVFLMMRVEDRSAQAPSFAARFAANPNWDFTEQAYHASSSFAESGAEAGERKAIIRVARSYLGTPYYSMNCSEYTSAVYAEATGVLLPADYIAQRDYGYAAPVLKRGDLLLYGDGVAIYWGNGNAIMASHYWGEVTIIDMAYLYGYIGARRIR